MAHLEWIKHDTACLSAWSLESDNNALDMHFQMQLYAEQLFYNVETPYSSLFEIVRIWNVFETLFTGGAFIFHRPWGVGTNRVEEGGRGTQNKYKIIYTYLL